MDLLENGALYWCHIENVFIWTECRLYLPLEGRRLPLNSKITIRIKFPSQNKSFTWNEHATENRSEPLSRNTNNICFCDVRYQASVVVENQTTGNIYCKCQARLVQFSWSLPCNFIDPFISSHIAKSLLSGQNVPFTCDNWTTSPREQSVSLFGMRDEGTPFKEHFYFSLDCIASVFGRRCQS